MHLLILGGTTEARQLAERLSARPGVDATLSLAGRTSAPVLPAVPVRVGGFGGANGLAGFLRKQRVDILIDATHPYAAVISANAAAAARSARVPLLALRRPPWQPQAGDAWTEVADMKQAVGALGAARRRVFLAVGREEIGSFAGAPQHFYLIRSVDPVEPPLPVPRATYVIGRGPFSEAHDRELLCSHRIGIVVAKNSGGSAVYGKIAAARTLGLPVILLRRPALPQVPAVETIEAALAWLDHAIALPPEPAARGV